MHNNWLICWCWWHINWLRYWFRLRWAHFNAFNFRLKPIPLITEALFDVVVTLV